MKVNTQKCRSLFISLSLILFLISCSRPPEASHYDAEGIISIAAADLDAGTDWETEDSLVAASLVSKGLEEPAPGTFAASFYLRTPGAYALWILGSSMGNEQDRNAIQVRLAGSGGEYISTHRIELPQSTIPQWVHTDQFTEEPAVLYFEEPGFYELQFESGGLPGFVVTKIHLSKDGDVRPEGMGFPETTDWRIDPLMEKRLEQASIPPAWAFGSLTNSSSVKEVDGQIQFDASLLDSIDGSMQGLFTFSNEIPDFSGKRVANGQNRTLHLYPMKNLQQTHHKKYPAPWFRIGNGFAGLADAVESISDPLRATYESPYTVLLPDQDVWGDEELLARTMQVLAFQPIFYLPVPESSMMPGTAEKLEELIKIRQRLFPYIYSYTLRARTTGKKPVTGLADQPRQFFLGEHILVTPILEPGMREQELHLPEGKWYRGQSGELFEGGGTVQVITDLHTSSIFFKAGGIVPMRPQPAPVMVGSNDRLELNIYSGDSGTFRLYEDDGVSFDYRTGAYSTIAYRYFEGEGYATFNIGSMVNGFEGRRDSTKYILRFRYMDRPGRIMANGEELQRGEGEDMWRYDDTEGVVIRWRQTDNRRTVFRMEF